MAQKGLLRKQGIWLSSKWNEKLLFKRVSNKERLNVIYIFRTIVINTYIVPTIGQVLPKHFIYINL